MAAKIELLPGTLFLLILRTVKSGPQHGYGIARRIKECSRDRLTIEDGSLYPALNRLVVKGWLKADWGISDNHRKARFYELTEEGAAQLDKESRQFDELVEAIRLVMRMA